MVGCSKCGGVILADTEDWENPLCYSHYHQQKIDGIYDELWNLIDEIHVLKNKALKLGEDMKDVISVDKLLLPSSLGGEDG